MKKIKILLLTGLFVFSCEKFKVAGIDSDKLVNVSSEDKEMNKIIGNSRTTFNVFAGRLMAHDKSERDFSVKYPFETDPGSTESIEHLWIDNIEYKDGIYYGFISNEPYYINKIKYGDKVSFDSEKISDWKYVKDGYLVGGESIIYLIKNMSKKERKEILDNLDYKIRGFN